MTTQNVVTLEQFEKLEKVVKANGDRLETVETEQGVIERVKALEEGFDKLEKNVEKQNDRVWLSINEILKKLNTQEKAQGKTDLKVDNVKTAVEEVKTQVTRNSAQQDIYMTEVKDMNTWLREQHAGKSAAAVALEQSREETKRTRITGFWEWTKVITTSVAITIGAIATLVGAVTAFVKLFL